MRDDVGTNEFLVRSGRRAIFSNDTRACRLANLANVLDDVSEHYLPTAVGGDGQPLGTQGALVRISRESY